MIVSTSLIELLAVLAITFVVGVLFGKLSDNSRVVVHHA